MAALLGQPFLLSDGLRLTIKKIMKDKCLQ